MKKKIFSMCALILSLIFIITSFAQNPGPASNPMTAPGAIGISLGGHSLIWENPLYVDYNEVYFSEDSTLVANLDPGVRIYNGAPSTVFDSALLDIYGPLTYNTKYFWRVVEHNSSGSTASPLWYFKSKSPAVFSYEHFFNSGSEGWEIFGPYGFDNWYWSNTSFAGGSPGEMVFRWDPVFMGDSYLISPEFPAAANSYMILGFRFYEDWWSDTVVVGCAYTTDDGNSWTSIWELNATGNVGPDVFITDLYVPGNFRLGFYYSGDSNNIDFLYIDDIGMGTALTVSQSPSFLLAQVDTTELKVHLQWDPGYSPAPITGYQIQRKNGLPTATSSFSTIANVDSVTFSFEDQNVELNNTFNYRVCTVSGPGDLSSYGNEATAYVPAIVPVELISFTGLVSRNEVTLNWITATEINNAGFELERRQMSNVKNQMEWEQIGFIEGKGTTTKPVNYSFVDENVKTGTYQYRLKQIDFDGTFKFSNEIEVEVEALMEFSLEQNYPNPFNPSTKIIYTIPTDGTVWLKVYDVLGNEIATPVNEEKSAGKYELVFDATGLPSGIYFYQLQAGLVNQTKKMILLK